MDWRAGRLGVDAGGIHVASYLWGADILRNAHRYPDRSVSHSSLAPPLCRATARADWLGRWSPADRSGHVPSRVSDWLPFGDRGFTRVWAQRVAYRTSGWPQSGRSSIGEAVIGYGGDFVHAGYRPISHVECYCHRLGAKRIREGIDGLSGGVRPSAILARRSARGANRRASRTRGGAGALALAETSTDGCGHPRARRPRVAGSHTCALGGSPLGSNRAAPAALVPGVLSAVFLRDLLRIHVETLATASDPVMGDTYLVASAHNRFQRCLMGSGGGGGIVVANVTETGGGGQHPRASSPPVSSRDNRAYLACGGNRDMGVLAGGASPSIRGGTPLQATTVFMVQRRTRPYNGGCAKPDH